MGRDAAEVKPPQSTDEYKHAVRDACLSIMPDDADIAHWLALLGGLAFTEGLARASVHFLHRNVDDERVTRLLVGVEEVLDDIRASAYAGAMRELDKFPRDHRPDTAPPHGAPKVAP